MATDSRTIVTADPARRDGRACIRGTRITVQDVLEYFAGGMSVEQLLGEFPNLTREDVQACSRSRRMLTSEYGGQRHEPAP